MAFEYAEKTDDEAARKAAITFVIIGGGPTGVEMAGAIAEISRYTLAKDFRHIDPSQARVILIEGDSRLLSAFPEDLSAKRSKQLGISAWTCAQACDATNLTEDGVQLGDELFPAVLRSGRPATHASFIGKTLGASIDRVGRVVVNDDLTIPGHPEVQVIGDLANFLASDRRTIAWRIACSDPTRAPRCAQHSCNDQRAQTSALSLLGQGKPGNNWAEQSGCRPKIHPFEWSSRVAGVVVCAHHLLGRFSKPLARPFSMGLGVFYVR